MDLELSRKRGTKSLKSTSLLRARMFDRCLSWCACGWILCTHFSVCFVRRCLYARFVCVQVGDDDAVQEPVGVVPGAGVVVPDAHVDQRSQRARHAQHVVVHAPLVQLKIQGTSTR